MFATCKHTSGGELPPPANGAAYTPTSDFHLTRGRRYKVGGFGVFEGVSLVLVRDDTDRPNWRPLAAFDVAVQPIPANWKIAAEGDGTLAEGWVSIIGYPQLVSDPSHLRDLMERDAEALGIYASEVDPRPE